MTTPNAPDEAPEPTDLTDDDLAYEPPPELAEDAGGGGGRPAPSSLALKLAAVAALALVVGGALLVYRSHHRKKVVAAALAQADALLRLDTAAGYRQAATLLEPIAQLDPMQGGSVRAFALAMLFADYRIVEAEKQADDLLVTPGRAEVVPVHAHLAAAALAIGRREAGTATTSVARAGDGPWALALQARIALLAGNVEAALSPAASAAAEGAFPPGLALHGDSLRRLRRDPGAARAAYEASLAASPGQPRAAFGLAKLALSGDVPAEQAEAALRRLAADRDRTPAPERGRAALHLAALRLRAGDPAGADDALDGAGLDPAARGWASRAAYVAAERRGGYRAVAGAPPSLQSASDDDPGELAPTPPPPPPPPAAAPAPKMAAKKAPPKKVVAKGKQAASRKMIAKKPPATAKKAAAKKPAKKPSKKAVAKKSAAKATSRR
jgi:outer membrane biosynthesis protein TonB